MSDDLIKREDAIEAYSDIYWIDDRLNIAFREELDKIDEKIRNIPTVEVADRPQGEWIIRPKGFGIEAKICSVCGTEKNSMSNYCPNCGAKMGGERKDDE